MTRWPVLDRTSTERVRTLTRKLTASPTLPLLGWTKAVESLITAPETLVRGNVRISHCSRRLSLYCSR